MHLHLIHTCMHVQVYICVVSLCPYLGASEIATVTAAAIVVIAVAIVCISKAAATSAFKPEMIYYAFFYFDNKPVKEVKFMTTQVVL